MAPSCSARSSSIAQPNKPNSALLTTNSTSTPAAAKAASILSQALGCSRSQGIKIGSAPPAPTISPANSSGDHHVGQPRLIDDRLMQKRAPVRCLFPSPQVEEQNEDRPISASPPIAAQKRTLPDFRVGSSIGSPPNVILILVEQKERPPRGDLSVSN